MQISIISAGQTGADYGALLAARELGLQIEGYSNNGYRTENAPNLKLKEWGLLENDKPSCASTDRKNVDLTDVLIAFRYRIPMTGRGTECVVNYALTKKYKHVPLDDSLDYQTYEGKKPVIVFWNLDNKNMDSAISALKDFISKYNPTRIMISGPCRSTVDCEQLVKNLLIKSLQETP